MAIGSSSWCDDAVPPPGVLAGCRVVLIDVFFATNRIPLSPYRPVFIQHLPRPFHLSGQATVRMGGQNKDWELCISFLTTDQEGRRPSLRLDKLDEQASSAVTTGP